MKTVFVTVGTTRFDELVESITSPENVQVRKGVFKQNHVPLFTIVIFIFYIIILFIILTICAAY